MPERGELSRYPDSDFGVVMFGREGKLRKFACTSPEVAWLNGQYLAESWDGMPKTAAVVAGVKLLEKMEEGGYSSPGLVAKVASAIPTVTARDGEVREIEGLGSIVDIRDWEKLAEFSNVPRDNLGGPPGAVIDGHPEAVKQWKSALQKSRQEGGAPLWHYGNAARASRQKTKTAFDFASLGAGLGTGAGGLLGALSQKDVRAQLRGEDAHVGGKEMRSMALRGVGGALAGGVAGGVLGEGADALYRKVRYRNKTARMQKSAFTLVELGAVGALGAGTVGAGAGFYKARKAGATKTETLKRTAGGALKGGAIGLLPAAGVLGYAAATNKLAALNDKYPLQTDEQIKQAMVYFDRFWKNFHPTDRREYGGDQLNEGFVLHLNARASRVDERGGAILMKLASVATHKGPDEFGQALTQFDEHYGLSQEWDRDLPDPYRAAFSEKTASEDATYHWTKGIDRVTGADLLRVARNDSRLVHSALGGDIAKEFVKKPVTIFKSLPYPQQVILARLADSRSHVRGSS
jgi:hypothetical protein